jgi:PAS domain S-box-containing protein
MKAGNSVATTADRFQTLFDNTPEIILYQNESSTILDANAAFLKLVGESHADVVSQDFHEFLSIEVRPLFIEKLSEAFTGKTVRFEMYFAYKNSIAVHWDVVKVPLIKNQQVLGVYMIARDITEKVEAQDRIHKQNKDLQQFSYMVAHNLRGPISNAIGLVEILETVEPYTHTFDTSFAYLKSSLLQLDQVMKDMTSILSIRNKETTVEQEDVSLCDVVNQVVENLHEDIQSTKGTVIVVVPVSLKIRTSKAFVYSIFFNLISNSIKYRVDGRPLHIELTGSIQDDNSKLITIRDNGIGINLEKAGENIFKLYKRFHPQYPGRGMGLYIVKTHVESMGGKIWVSSEPNQGTTFTIKLR